MLFRPNSSVYHFQCKLTLQCCSLLRVVLAPVTKSTLQNALMALLTKASADLKRARQCMPTMSLQPAQRHTRLVLCCLLLTSLWNSWLT
jgi:hypothetical protein